MNWKYKCELNQVITKANDEYDLSKLEDPCPQEVLELFALEVEKAPPLKEFGNVLRGAKTLAETNHILENVFDTADAKAVWCGM